MLGRPPEFIVIGGPTASGKSALAIQMAKSIGGAIVCCDSVQVYRGFDIGSAKPTADERVIVPHYLFDILDWSDPFDAALYAQAAKIVMTEIKCQGLIPIIVGGTGLYLRALLGDAWDDDIPSDNNLRLELAKRDSLDLYGELQSRDPRRAANLHSNDRFRVIRALEINILTGSIVQARQSNAPSASNHLMIFLNPDRQILHDRIKTRTSLMLEGGLVREVERLLASGVDPASKPMQSIGYKQVVQMRLGVLAKENLEEKIIFATRQYAKRQVTWFKKVHHDLQGTGERDFPRLIEMTQNNLIKRP
jgi:tRNA dimethylallyltransferase